MSLSTKNVIQAVQMLLLIVAVFMILEQEESHYGPMGGIGTIFYTLPAFLLLVLSFFNVLFGIHKSKVLAIVSLTTSVFFLGWIFVLTDGDSERDLYLTAPFLLLVVNFVILGFTIKAKK